MKKILFTLLFATTSQASPVQFIDCRSLDSGSNDHVIVSLTSESQGTFFYTEGLDSEGNDRRTGKLNLVRTGMSGSNVKFNASFEGDDYGTPTTVDFEFYLPKNLLFKASNYFETSFIANGSKADLGCFSSIYEN